MDNKKKNRFATLSIPFALMVVCVVMNFLAGVVACSAIFVSGVIVICTESLLEQRRESSEKTE